MMFIEVTSKKEGYKYKETINTALILKISQGTLIIKIVDGVELESYTAKITMVDGKIFEVQETYESIKEILAQNYRVENSPKYE